MPAHNPFIVCTFQPPAHSEGTSRKPLFPLCSVGAIARAATNLASRRARCEAGATITLRRFQQKEALKNRHKQRLQKKTPYSPSSALLCRLFQTISFLVPAYRDMLGERGHYPARLQENHFSRPASHTGLRAWLHKPHSLSIRTDFAQGRSSSVRSSQSKNADISGSIRKYRLIFSLRARLRRDAQLPCRPRYRSH